MTFTLGMCWPYALPGAAVQVPCPDYIHGFYTKGNIVTLTLTNSLMVFGYCVNK